MLSRTYLISKQLAVAINFDWSNGSYQMIPLVSNKKVRWSRIKTIVLLWQQLIILIRFQRVSNGFTQK